MSRFVIGLSYDSAFLYEGCVDVYFADVVYDYGKLYASFIGENVIEQSCLTAPEIAREQQDWCSFTIHFDVMLMFCRIVLDRVADCGSDAFEHGLYQVVNCCFVIGCCVGRHAICDY